MGDNGETGSHDCPADRTEGSTATCTFEDEAKIGKLVGIEIENTGDDAWRLVEMIVESSEGWVGRWEGDVNVHDYLTRTLTFSFTYRKKFSFFSFPINHENPLATQSRHQDFGNLAEILDHIIAKPLNHVQLCLYLNGS